MGVYNRDYMRGGPLIGSSYGGTPITWWLIGINAGLWFLYAGARSWGGDGGLYGFMSSHLPIYPAEVFGYGKIWQPFTAMWLHDSSRLTHVFFNMIFLFFFGRVVEGMLGRKGYLRLYLLAGLTSTLSLVPWFWLTGDATPALGASGAVYGVGVFLAFRQPRMQVIFIVIRMPLWFLVGVIMVGFEVIQFAVMRAGTGGTVGHLAGAAFGWAYHASLGAGWARRGPFAWWGRLRARRREAAWRRERDEDRDVRRRVDELLAKIHEEGIGALSDAEKDFLQRASGRLRTD